MSGGQCRAAFEHDRGADGGWPLIPDAGKRVGREAGQPLCLGQRSQAPEGSSPQVTPSHGRHKALNRGALGLVARKPSMA